MPDAMQPVNMLQAKSTLSQLVESIEQGREREIVIARDGRPFAKLAPLDAGSPAQRIGIAKGRFTLPDSINAQNETVARLFAGDAP